MRLLETDSLSNQSIASATAIGAYTADAARHIMCRVLLAQVAGAGDYICYVTVQRGGSGSHHVMLPKTTATAASGETAIGLASIGLPVSTGDVVTVYVDGLAGDTTTPDTTVDWYEVDTLRPATADRTLVVDGNGRVDLSLVEGTDATDALTAAAEAALVSTDATVGAVAADVTTLLGRLSAARAGYLDNLSAGAVATAAKLLSLFQSALRNDVTVDADIGGTYSDATHSQQALSAASAPSAATVADAVWDELLSGHVVSGSAGAALTTAGSAADPLLNTVPGSYASGTGGHALGRIGSGQINTTGVVTQSGSIDEIQAGATYASSDGFSFDWTDADNVWPTLTSATITISLSHPNGQTQSYTGSVVTATGSSKKVRLELTATQSAALAVKATGVWSMLVWATLSGGGIRPLVGGTARVKDGPGIA